MPLRKCCLIRKTYTWACVGSDKFYVLIVWELVKFILKSLWGSCCLLLLNLYAFRIKPCAFTTYFIIDILLSVSCFHSSVTSVKLIDCIECIMLVNNCCLIALITLRMSYRIVLTYSFCICRDTFHFCPDTCLDTCCGGFQVITLSGLEITWKILNSLTTWTRTQNSSSQFLLGVCSRGSAHRQSLTEEKCKYQSFVPMYGKSAFNCRFKEIEKANKKAATHL